MVLRFQPLIDHHASRLGDLIHIDHDQQHWSNIPLDSHPKEGRYLTKQELIHWMMERLGSFQYTWEGKTKIQVHELNQTPKELLILKAKKRLIKTTG